MSALHYASNSNCVNVLVWWGAVINTRSSTGKTPLYCAVERGSSPDAVDALLQRGAKVNKKSRDEGWIPLHVASLRGLVPIVEILLAWNANANAKDKRRSTPLHMCAGVRSRDSEEICRRLLAKRIKAAPRDINGATPLHLACGSGNVAVLPLILSKMCKNLPDASSLVDQKGFTPYHYAALGGHTECIDVLKRELPVCEQWLDDLQLSYATWGLITGHFTPEFYPPGTQAFCSDFLSVVNDESTCDIVFIVEGQPVFGHKTLCSTSPYLTKLIEGIIPIGDPSSPDVPPRATSHRSRETIEVKGTISHKIFVDVILFMYTANMPTDTDWNLLWHAAFKMEVLRLQQLCEKELGGTPLRDRSQSASMRDSLTYAASRRESLSSVRRESFSLSDNTSIRRESFSYAISPVTINSNTNNTDANSNNSGAPAATLASSASSHSISQTTTDNTTQPQATEPQYPTDTSPTDLPELTTSTPSLTRRRASTKKRSISATRLRMNMDPQLDYLHELSLTLGKLVGNTLFHDMLFMCGEELVYAHKIIVQKRCPNFFFALAKSIHSDNRNTDTIVFHFDDITKGAMTGLMEYFYCGCFRSKLEAEDVWVLYNFILKYGIVCPGLKEKTGQLFYTVISPDNLLEIFALNYYGFTINTLPPSNNTDSAVDATKAAIARGSSRSSRRESDGGPSSSNAVHANSTEHTRPPLTSSISVDSINYRASINLPNIHTNEHANSTETTRPPLPASHSADSINYRSSIALPNLYRHSVTVNTLNTSSAKPTTTVHTSNQEITLTLLKYANKKDVLKYITKNGKDNPTIKLLQKELRRCKADLETDTTKLWQDRRKETKIFAKVKKEQIAEAAKKHHESKRT